MSGIIIRIRDIPAQTAQSLIEIVQQLDVDATVTEIAS